MYLVCASALDREVVRPYFTLMIQHTDISVITNPCLEDRFYGREHKLFVERTMSLSSALAETIFCQYSPGKFSALACFD